MKKTVPIALLLLACSLFLAPGAALADTKAVLGFPTLGTGNMAADLYLYSCKTSACSSITQLAEYGHITNVPRWPKGNGGPGGPAPQTWAFLTIAETGYQYYQFWQQNPSNSSCWQSCILGINAQGELDNKNTTCLGTVTSGTPTHTNEVPEFSFGAAMFGNATCGTAPAKMSASNVLPARSITFKSGSLANTLCLQNDSSFNHPQCTGAGAYKVTPQVPYVITSTDLVNGNNSGVGQVSAVQAKDGGEWIYTGRGVSSNAQVYATNLEYTVWPQHTQSTMGPTTIDISLVNGFNMGATLTPDTDCVCSVADSEGGAPHFVLYKAGTPMAVFPKPQDTVLSYMCPQDSEAPISGNAKYGCYSSCSKARYYGSADQDRMCCSGAYNTPGTCIDPPNQPYVQNLNKYSTRVYSWAFNDWRGTFTCEPTASFTFTITDIDELM
jgi:hypothetical protein